MKKITLLFLFFVLTLNSYTQNGVSFTGDVGINYFDGDVTQHTFLPGSTPSLSFGGSVEYHLNDIWGLSSGVYYLPMIGESNYVTFNNKLYQNDYNVTLNFTKLFIPSWKSNFSIYTSLGVGFSYYTFNPIIKDQNRNITRLIEPKYDYSFNVPFRLYLDYSISKKLSIGGKITYTSNNKDNLEGIIINGQAFKGVTNDYNGSATFYIRYKIKTKNIQTKIIDDKFTLSDTIKEKDNKNNIIIINSFNNSDVLIKDSIKKDSIKKDIIKDDKIYLPSIFFDFNSYILDDNSLNIIKQASNIMNENPNYFIQINGYTDYVGDVAYNEKLSIKRTEVIKDILVHKHNISSDRIITNGLGKITEPNIRYRGNRRCDLIIYKIK